MRHLLIPAVLFASLTAATLTPVQAAPIDDAEKAYFIGDFATALKIVQPLAAQGDAKALNRLGSMYQLGRGIEKNSTKAIELYLQSAAKGNAEAQNNLGISYLAGDGVAFDVAKAAEWFEKAAAQGYSYAHNNLGIIYGNGPGGYPRDPVRGYMHASLSKAQEYGMKDGKKDFAFLDMPNPLRDTIIEGNKMTPAQQAEGKARAKACFERNFKNCK